MGDVEIYILVYLSLMSVTICWLISQYLLLQKKLSELESLQKKLSKLELAVSKVVELVGIVNKRIDALKEKK